MGGGASSSACKSIRKDWMDTFTAMGLSTADVNKLSTVFSTLIIDANGKAITIANLLVLLDIDRTRFNEKIFSNFDKNNTGCLDFYTFVISLWRFCCLQRMAINGFVFEMYDTDNDGRINVSNIENMFLDLFGTKGMEQETNKNSLAECLKKTNFEGQMIMNGFQNFCKTRQMMLSPVFNMHQALQTATLGNKGWEVVANRNVEIHGGRNMSVRELLALHIDSELFDSLLDEGAPEQIVSDQMRTVLRNTLHRSHRAAPRLTISTTSHLDGSVPGSGMAVTPDSSSSAAAPQGLTPTNAKLTASDSYTAGNSSSSIGRSSSGSSKKHRGASANATTTTTPTTSILKQPAAVHKSAAPVRRAVSGSGGGAAGRGSEKL